MERQQGLENELSKSLVPVSKLKISKELFSNIPLQLRGLLTPVSKEFLTCPSDSRDSNTISKVITELEDIDFFQKFPDDTKLQLAKKMSFVVREADQYLLRQGDAVEAMYLIVSGVVSLRYNIDTSSNLQNKARWPEQVLQRGDIFGHVDLMQDRQSVVDAYTLGYAEFLMLKKNDFGIIQSHFEGDSKRLKLYLRSIELLRRFDWSEEELRVLEVFCKVHNYLEEVEIYSGAQGVKPHWSYFVVTGECELAREISYCATESGIILKHLKLPESNANQNLKVTKKLVEFEKGKQGFHFGVGERFGENRVLATPASEFLLVPRLILVFKNRELLSKMATDLENSLPSDQTVLERFIDYEEATQAVASTLKDMLKDKPSRLISSEKSVKKPRFYKHV
ncbi:cyclic nucleotide-binding domain-containing protein [Caerostris darwini]|uniref:Cyclic nucleotide-binding domain-containing protein n=1 Tax=Caerostris darwini TaxID=1538125 RepID=A0AAV4WT89_9ARAC|nr:cyclic nucleotide-binding domain-containing protein [Caerostris darwini]